MEANRTRSGCRLEPARSEPRFPYSLLFQTSPQCFYPALIAALLPWDLPGWPMR